jgi:hypothetical protein
MINQLINPAIIQRGICSVITTLQSLCIPMTNLLDRYDHKLAQLLDPNKINVKIYKKIGVCVYPYDFTNKYIQ